MEDRPKSLRDKAERMARMQMLEQEHILPLTNFVKEIRQEQGLKKEDIPYFDPLDGGIEAQCLFVLESPGPKTKESSFVSRDNNDETAKNFFEVNEVAVIPRKKTIIWNIVPWYLGKAKKIENAKSSDIRAGLPYLYRLIDLLPKLEVVVLIGKKAQSIGEELDARYTGMKVFTCPHPSPQFVNRKPDNRQKIIDALKPVSEFLADEDPIASRERPRSLSLPVASLIIAVLALIAAGVSAYYSYRSNSDSRLILQLDRHPLIKVAAHPNQSGKSIWVENRGDASALDLQIQALISVYDPEDDEIKSQTGYSAEEWFTPELSAGGDPFVARLDVARGSLPYLFESDTLQPGRHVLEARVTFQRGVDCLRYEERALYVYSNERRWIAAKEVNTDSNLLNKYGPAIRCALAQPLDHSFVPFTDAVESRSGYGADLEKK